jgi:hypothetical protein
MLDKHRNTKKQGDEGLGCDIAWFTSRGYTVCVPLTDSQAYDLVVDDGDVRRVQVKTTTYRRNKHFSVSMTIKGGNRSGIGKIKRFDSSAVDYVFIVTGDGCKYLIPSAEIKQNTILNSGFDQYKVGM